MGTRAGQHIYQYFFKNIHKQSRKVKLQSQICTGSGVFPDPLHRVERKDALNCAWDELGIIKHHLSACPLTHTLDLVQITKINEQLWHNQYANNKHVKNKGNAVISNG